jgi:hypothetical protein
MASSAQQFTGSEGGSTGNFAQLATRGDVAVANTGIKNTGYGGAHGMRLEVNRVDDFGH